MFTAASGETQAERVGNAEKWFAVAESAAARGAAAQALLAYRATAERGHAAGERLRELRTINHSL
jgi:hypothetical protein